jgi:lysozyme family protein
MRAEFLPAFRAMIPHEGFPGYANNHNDSGGETVAGISRVNWPGSKVWEIVDGLKGSPNFPGNLKTSPGLLASVMAFYQANFWTPYLAQMPQEIANWVFDKGVNMGIRQANKLVQRAASVNDDGILGPLSITAINSAIPADLLAKCRAEAEAFYRELVANNPKDAEFLDGWLKRC